MNGKIYIETQRLILRQWIEEDRTPFAKLNSSKKVMEFFPKVLSRNESHHIIDKAVEIGWRPDQKLWRRGLATEGAKAVLNDAFCSLNLKEVVAFTSTINHPSMKLMEKMGMRRDEKGDFIHPHVEEGSPLRQHVLYRILSF